MYKSSAREVRAAMAEYMDPKIFVAARHTLAQTQQPAVGKEVSMAQDAEDALVVKMIGVMHRADDYGSDLAQGHVCMARKKFFEDKEMKSLCLLTGKDTIDIMERGRSVRVLEPQTYCSVTTLDKTHRMFDSECEEEKYCRGFFSCDDDDGIAVSGSGGDEWYKVSPTLVEFCRQLRDEVESFSSDDGDLAELKSEFDSHIEESVKVSVKVDEECAHHARIVHALRESREKEVEKAFEIRRKMGGVIAAKRKREVLEEEGGLVG